MYFGGLGVLKLDEELVLREGVTDVHELRVTLHWEVNKHVFFCVVELVLGLHSFRLFPIERLENLNWFILGLCGLKGLRE
jgi:hypothetical protein